MRRWGRWVAAGLVVAVAVWVGRAMWTARQARLQQQVRDAGYRERVVELRKAYPKGTPRLVVEKGTGVKPWSDPKELEEELVFAHDPARRWNCSTLDSYAVFMFADGPDRDAEPLVSIDLEQEDGDCFKLP